MGGRHSLACFSREFLQHNYLYLHKQIPMKQWEYCNERLPSHFRLRRILVERRLLLPIVAIEVVEFQTGDDELFLTVGEALHKFWISRDANSETRLDEREA